jgi:hypothetical protein
MNHPAIVSIDCGHDQAVSTKFDLVGHPPIVTMRPALITELRRIFGPDTFDGVDVWAAAHRDQSLAAAIDAEIPRSRYRSGSPQGTTQRLRHQDGVAALARLGCGGAGPIGGHSVSDASNE